MSQSKPGWVKGTAKPKKFTHGERITGIQKLINRLVAGKWVYFEDKPVHPRFVLSMPLGSVLRLLRWKSVYEAKPNR